MTKEELRIIYMGTPDFAVEPLKLLVAGGYNIVGVLTICHIPRTQSAATRKTEKSRVSGRVEITQGRPANRGCFQNAT